MDLHQGFVADADQAEAIGHAAGHALVFAGPGSGKTGALAARVRRLAEASFPGSILCCTFTVRAADELRSRLAGVPAGDDGPWVGTFHGIANRLLRMFPADAGLPKGFSVLDEAAQRDLVLSSTQGWSQDDGDLAAMVSRWKDLGIDPQQALATQGGDPRLAARAADAYAAYEAEKTRMGAVDFSDMISRATALLSAGGRGGIWFANRFSDVLVDEFQDTNSVQVAFLKAMAAGGASVWAVADDDQSIFGWRGSDARYCLDFADHFSGARTYRLGRNYRCPPVVVAASSALIRRVAKRVDKPLRAVRPPRPGDLVVGREFARPTEEAEWIARRAAEHVARRADPSAVAVLGRTAAALAPVQVAFEREQVPFHVSGGEGFWGLPETRLVVAALRLVRNPADREATAAAGRGKRALALAEFGRTMRGAGLAQSAPAAGRLVRDFVPFGADPERRAQWMDAAEQAAAQAMSHPDLDSFLEAVTLSESVPFGEGVALLTAHASKGLEFDTVVVVGCDSEMFPHSRATDMDEERRLLYVAATRAKRALFLTWSLSRMGRAVRPSPYLKDLWSGASRAEGRSEFPHSVTGLPEAGRPVQATPAVPGRPVRKGGGRTLISPDERDS
jgi:DNA helicase-2/ATP-dependent DNA helicase PcrA